MKEYFNHLNKQNIDANVIAMKAEAKKKDIPIISDEGLIYLLQLIRLTEAKRILEIGTAIAYTAINIAMLNKDIIVDTIEKDEKMVVNAQENIKRSNLEKQIQIFHEDALEIALDLLKGNYDLIFIDAAKAQYQKFFEKFEVLLNDGGIIVCDNLLFHGLMEGKEEIKSRNLRALVRKIKDFNNYLAQNNKFHTVFLKIGDGMAVSEKL